MGLRKEGRKALLVIGDGFDIEAEGGTDDTCVLSIDFQHNCSLPRIVKTPVRNNQLKQTNTQIIWYRKGNAGSAWTYTMSMRISFSFLLIFLMMLRSPISPTARDMKMYQSELRKGKQSAPICSLTHNID